MDSNNKRKNSKDPTAQHKQLNNSKSHPQKRLMHCTIQRRSRLQRKQDIVNKAWALAAAGQLDKEVFAALLRAAVRRVGEFKPQAG